MDSAAKRRRRILEIIETNHISSQEALKDVLHEHNIRISQPTLSRDIKALNLIKIPSQDGSYRYGRPEIAADTLDLAGICSTFIRDFRHSGNMIILKTEPGTATVVGRSLDDAHWPEVVGTLAGTDTVFVVIAEDVSPEDFVLKIRMLSHDRGGHRTPTNGHVHYE